MGWELVIFAGMGAFVGLVYGVRTGLLWWEAHRRRRRALAAYPWVMAVRR